MFWFYTFGLLMAVCLGAYAAYWSLRVGRALRVRDYARQELIVGSFSVYGTILFCLFYLVDFLVPSLAGTPAGALVEAFYVVFPALTFAWVDSSVRVGRRTDPLRRDPLRWSKTRLVFWPLLLLTLVGFFIPGFLYVAPLLSFVIIGVAIIPVFLAASWSGDRNYRRSLEWFGLALAVLVAQNVGFNTLLPGLGLGIVYSPVAFIWSIIANLVIVPIMFGGIYKCARALVPLNRITP